ncbi:hypothetical protein LEN26_011105 [Aphanomyces euteiches]|nr:hypothetical protein AeMF1_010673 [Aphanomyces euteiches]KAH9120444.1 hypothetical protein LEN26_011105 [Aphanomyces euteiches]KAH9196878.1 hypothetical protein AeNC1_001132 [Aphanomyces euteiches]
MKESQVVLSLQCKGKRPRELHLAILGDKDNASQPTVCSSSSCSSASTMPPRHLEDDSNDTCNVLQTHGRGTYKDALLCRSLEESVDTLPSTEIDNLSTASVASTLSPPDSPVEISDNQAPSPVFSPPLPPLPPSPPLPNDSQSRMSRHSKASAARIETSVLRGAIAHAAAQGVLSKSSKREMRQSMLRGQTNVILERLRRKCHLQPVVAPQTLPSPSEFELRLTNGLLKCINALAPLQDGDRLAAKHMALVEVNRTVDKWMQTMATTQSATGRRQHKALVFVGGSSYLKVDMGDSVMDLAVLCPHDVAPSDFFTDFRALLDETSVDEATFVPTLHCSLHDVHLALVFARYTQTIVPSHLPLHSDHILAGMDAHSVRALTVPRTASLVLELVPNPSTFRTVLRVVRLWAKMRGVDSAKMGFLRGVSWTVLVAFVCQMYPTATPALLVHHFFIVLSTWTWPMPIMLAKPYDAGHGFPQWSPSTDVHDRGHVMPILTPGYPAMNSATTVTLSTLRVLREEWTRGKLILDDMQLNALSSPVAWTTLFAPSDFTVRYDHYLHVRLTSVDDQPLARLASIVTTRLRKLVDTLQLTEHVLSVHPFPTLFQDDCATTMKTKSSEATQRRGGSFFVGFEVARNMSPTAIVAPVLKYFVATQLQLKTGVVTIDYASWQDLPDAIFPQGRDHAAGDRAKYMLSRAHKLHMAALHHNQQPPQPPLPPSLTPSVDFSLTCNNKH